MLRIRFFLALVFVCGFSPPSLAHPTEPQYGAPINSRSSPQATTGESRGKPEFTLLALTANLTALEQDLKEERTAGVRDRAGRLPGMALELVARSDHLGELERRKISLAAQVILTSAERIDSAATGQEDNGVLRELAIVRRQIAGLKDMFRDLND